MQPTTQPTTMQPTTQPTTMQPTTQPTTTTQSSAFAQLFTQNVNYTMPGSVNSLKIFMIGGGGSGFGGHYGAGGAGYITTVGIGQISKGTVISVVIGGGGRTPTGNSSQSFEGQATTVTILGKYLYS